MGHHWPTWRQEPDRGSLCGVSRFDVALDMQCDKPSGLREQILRRLVLKWRPKGAMHEVSDTVYWGRHRHSRRNLVLYTDKHNKMTGELDCVHLELRFLRSDIIRKQGIARPSDLIKLDPKALFAKHLKWTNLADRYVKKITRKIFRSE
jgi:hypothetical protein